MRKNQIAISLSFILTLQLLPGGPLSAYGAVFPMSQEIHYAARGGMGGSQTDQRLISSLEDLVQWYNALSGWSEWPVLEADIIIDRPVTLSETSRPKDLGAIQHKLRVVAGGILTLNNPRLSIQGPDTVIVVEHGGQLLLQNGSTSTAPTSHAIVVEKGGRCLKSSSFMLDGGGIMDKNQSNGLPGDSDSDHAPDPPAEQARPITSIVGVNGSLTCNVGERPEQSDYPSIVRVVYRVAELSFEQIDLPIQWNLDPVNFDVAGAYTVKGSFSEEVLLEHNLSNPNGIFATLELSVQERGPIKALTGNVLSIGSDGLCLVRLTVPILPSDVEALYVYRSADGEHWQKCVGQIIDTAYEDFLPFIQSISPNTYINYRYQTDYRPIWLRVEVVGSYVAGISNEIRLEMPASAKPGEGTHTGEKGDDGTSDGNRGGGGQSEGERELPVSGESAGEENIFPTQEKLPDKYLPRPAVLPEESSEVGITASASEGAPKGIFESSGASIRPDILRDNPESEPLVSVPSAAEEETSTSTTESGELAVGGQSISAMPFQKSRGVLFTAEATAVAACGLVLLRKLYQKRKRKP